jgi:acyl dehydratase
MNLDYVLARRFAPIEQSYDARDSALYALSLGFGDDPLDEDELPFVYEGRGPLAVPSQCVTLGWPPFWHDEPGAQIAWRRILHGEQSFTLHRPLPVEGTIRAEHKILAVEDKGSGRGALIHFATEIGDAQTGAPLASLRAVQFLRDDGGCGGFGSPPPPAPPLVTDAAPIACFDYATSQQAALLYRQASRDYMPIHADPAIARDAGFDRPIAHGLNSFGLACRAILKRFAPPAPERIRSMSARFVNPAFPGDTIRVELFVAAEGVRFRARAIERNVLIVERGMCGLT